MLKSVIATLLLLGSVATHAQEVSPDLDLRKAECPKIAKAAGFAYFAKKEEGRMLAVTDVHKATGLMPLYQWSIDYATYKATGPDDAVHQAIEKCLKNVEMVKSASQRGQVLTVDDLK